MVLNAELRETSAHVYDEDRVQVGVNILLTDNYFFGFDLFAAHIFSLDIDQVQCCVANLQLVKPTYQELGLHADLRSLDIDDEQEVA